MSDLAYLLIYIIIGVVIGIFSIIVVDKRDGRLRADYALMVFLSGTLLWPLLLFIWLSIGVIWLFSNLLGGLSIILHGK